MGTTTVNGCPGRCERSSVGEIAFGVLMPGFGGMAISSITKRLPGAVATGRAVTRIFEHRHKIAEAVLKPFEDEFKDAMTGNMAEERAALDTLYDVALIQFAKLAEDLGNLSDREILLIGAVYDLERTTKAAYKRQLQEFVSKYQTQVMALGEQPPTGPRWWRFGGEARLDRR